jgi:hypothetical protein
MRPGFLAPDSGNNRAAGIPGIHPLARERTLFVSSLRRSVTRVCATAACALVPLLALSSPAAAGTLRYDIPSSPAYTVDNQQGIAKVTFNTCATAGQAQTLSFSVVTEVTGGNSGTATFKIMQADGPLAFNPSQVVLAPGTQRTDVVATITAPTATQHGAAFRFKFAPPPGVGIGEGPGVMVRIACVLAAGRTACPAPAATAAQNPGQGNGQANGQANGQGNGQGNGQANGQGNGQANGQGNGGNPNDGKDGNPNDGNAGRGNDRPAAAPAPGPACTTTASVTAPTSGVFLPLGATAAHQSAPCVATSRSVRLRAGDRSAVVVTVRRGGVAIAGAAVRIVGLGVNTTRLTGADGTVTLRVAPRRSGQLSIQSDTCFGVDRIAVLGAKSSSAGRAPAFTG